MKTGTRFWQLLAVVGLVLFAYALAELSDAVTAKRAELDSQRTLLARQEALLKDTKWPERERAIAKLRRQWQGYLPVEDSQALAKARLLSTWRQNAIDAGLTNVTVSALDTDTTAQGGTKTVGNAPTQGSTSGKGKNGKLNPVPAGVQMTKLTISARFEPVAFNKLLRTLEQGGSFIKIESAAVRSAQMDISLRAYWRSKASLAAAGNTTSEPVARPQTKS